MRLSIGLTMLTAAALIAGCASATTSQAEPAKTSAPVLLVGNKGEDSLSFIDLDSGREVARETTGSAPHEIALSPDGAQAAVVAYGGRSIDLFDIASRKKLRSIDLSPNAGPHGIVWLADGRIVVTTERSRSVAVVDPDSGKLLASIPTGQEGTHMIAVTRDGETAYTANIGSGTVSLIDLTARRKLRDLNVGGRPEGITLSQDERFLWVADLDNARVQAFDRASLERVAEVSTGRIPIRVASSPDGRWIVTSNLGDGSLTLIDAATHRRIRDIRLSGEQSAGQVTITFGPGGRLYAAETGNNTVAELDLATGQVLRRLPAGRQGDGLAIAAAGPDR